MAIAVVFNPISGAGRALAAAQRMASGLAEDGVDVELVPSERRPAVEWLRPRLAGVTHLVVAGGDGAVRMTAPEASRAGIPLWHAPCGTENLFARAFGMSRDPRSLARAIVAGRTRRIDLAHAGGERFTLMASIGFDADVVHALSARRTGGISHLSYARPILERLGEWRASEIAWSIDGEREELGPGLVFVGNLPDYGARLNPVASAVPDDGELDAVFLPARTAIELLPWVPLLRTGLHMRHPLLRVRRGREIVVHAAPAALVQVDGDAWQPDSGAPAVSELRLTCEPAALEVLLPRTD
jgi:diacylglycerol kinase family enzyme